MDFDGPGQAADAALFDVDDPACPELNRHPGVVGGVNALVQTNRGLDQALQLVVLVDVVVTQGLLDHEQAELVHLLEQGRILEGVGRVRVDHQHPIGEGRSGRPRVADVAPRLDLHLDPQIAVLQEATDLLDQRLGRGLNADADTHNDSIAYDVPTRVDILAEAEAGLLSEQIPDRALQPRFGEVVPAHTFEALGALARVAKRGLKRKRDQIVGKDMPAGLSGLIRVARSIRGVLAPADDAVADGPDKDDVSVTLTAEAGFERRNKRHANLIQVDLLEFHTA